MGQEQRQSNQDKPGMSIRIPFDEQGAASSLADSLQKALQGAVGRHVVIVCVGTDRSTGDAFGPIVGSKLESSTGLQGLRVYGTLNNPVHAVNLSSVLADINSEFSVPPFILAVDACLGKFDHVGHIILERGPLRPGAGVKKSLPEFGDYTLTGVVNVCGFMEYFVLQNTRLGIVMRMGEVVAESLCQAWQRFRIQESVIGAKPSRYGAFQETNPRQTPIHQSSVDSFRAYE